MICRVWSSYRTTSRIWSTDIQGLGLLQGYVVLRVLGLEMYSDI